MINFVNFSRGWKNNHKSYNNEEHQGNYVFTEYALEGISGPAIVGSYGVHDWIADSDLRLVLRDENYREFAKKIFPSQSGDPSESDIDLSKIHEAGIKTITDEMALLTHYFKWYVDENYVNGIREDWLKLRRYINYLYGSMLPDLNTDPHFEFVIVEGFFVPEEVIYAELPDFSHHSYLMNLKKLGVDQYIYEEKTKKTPLGAQSWASYAYYFSNLTTRVSYDNGQTFEDITGKYEAMAQCLGAMAHYIADAAYPGHLLKEWYDANGKEVKSIVCLGKWDAAAKNVYNTIFGQKTFGYGGPNWQSFNFDDLIIHAVIPYFAAQDVGRKNFDGDIGIEGLIEDENVYFQDGQYHFSYLSHPYAAENLPPRIDTSAGHPRCKELLKLAVHQTANALAFMLEKCLNKTCHEDTIGQRGTKDIIILDEVEVEAPPEIPSDYEEIEDILKSGGSDSEKNQALTSAVRMGLTSLLGLTIIALFKELIKKSIEVYGTPF